MAQLPQDPVPMRNNTVVIHVTRDVAFDLAKLNQITKEVLGRLGCGGCHSGRILDYRYLEEFTVNPQTLEVREVVGLKGP